MISRPSSRKLTMCLKVATLHCRFMGPGESPKEVMPEAGLPFYVIVLPRTYFFPFSLILKSRIFSELVHFTNPEKKFSEQLTLKNHRELRSPMVSRLDAALFSTTCWHSRHSFNSGCYREYYPRQLGKHRRPDWRRDQRWLHPRFVQRS